MADYTEQEKVLNAYDLVRWVAKYAWGSSPFLYPETEWNVNATSLIDYIHDATLIPKETLAEWVENAKNPQ